MPKRLWTPYSCLLLLTLILSAAPLRAFAQASTPPTTPDSAKPKSVFTAQEILDIGVDLKKLKDQIIAYGKLDVEYDSQKDAYRDAARAEMQRVKHIIITGYGKNRKDLDAIALAKQFNDLVALAAEQRCYSRDWINEYFPLIDEDETFMWLVAGLSDKLTKSQVERTLSAFDQVVEKVNGPTGQVDYIKFRKSGNIENIYQAQLLTEAYKIRVPFQNIKEIIGLVRSKIQMDALMMIFSKNECIFSDPNSITPRPFIHLAAEVKNQYQFEALSTVACVDVTLKGNQELIEKALQIDNDFQLETLQEAIRTKLTFQKGGFAPGHTNSYANAVECILKIKSDFLRTHFYYYVGWEDAGMGLYPARDLESCIERMNIKKEVEDKAIADAQKEKEEAEKKLAEEAQKADETQVSPEKPAEIVPQNETPNAPKTKSPEEEDESFFGSLLEKIGSSVMEMMGQKQEPQKPSGPGEPPKKD